MRHFQVLTNDQVEDIHDNALHILERVGVSIRSEKVRDIYAKAGARLEGELVFFPRDMVEKLLATMPSEFTLHARDPKHDVHLDVTGQVFVGPNCPPFVQNLDDGRHPGTLDDFDNLARLIQQLDNVDMLSQILCEPCDIDVDMRHLEMTRSALALTTKPFMGSCQGYQKTRECIELAAIPFGGVEEIRKHPVMTAIPCTLTPLGYDEDMLEGIMALADYNQPVMVNSLSMAGATSPVTVAGTLSVQHAEIIPGLILAQIVNPGNACIYSTGSTAADMRYFGLAIGAPEAALFSMANSQLAKFLGIPCRVNAALTDSKCVDSQSGYESMMNLLSASLAGANYLLHACGIIDSYNTVSYEKMVIDDEMIGMVKRIMKGIDVDEETLGFEAILEAGPRGSFITSDHTMEHYGEELFKPRLNHRATYKSWEDDGRKTVEQRANERWHKLLDEYEEPKLDPEVERDMNTYLEKAGESHGITF